MLGKIKSSVILLLLLIQSVAGMAADKGFLFFSGRVLSDKKAASQINVQVVRNKQEVASFSTKADGNFSVYLELNSSYEIKFTSPVHKDGTIKLTTVLPSTSQNGKYELSGDILLTKKTEQTREYLGYVWFSKPENKFVLSLQKAPAAAENKELKSNPVKDPSDPERIYGTADKSVAQAHAEAEKAKQDQVKNNASVKAEASASLVKSISEAEKKRKTEQTPEVCNEEKKEEDRYKTSTSILICNNNQKTRLRKVEYKWGSIYYYKDGLQISESEYEQVRKILKPKEK